jgi:hypothetical protein
MACAPFDLYRFTASRFYKVLSNDRFDHDQVASHQPACYLYDYLQNLKAEIIVVEYDYVDADYLDDYSSYYVKCFKPYNRRCKRIHFFSIRLSKIDFLRIILDKASSDETKIFRESYLGFIVARPLPDAIIGRTVLKSFYPENEARKYTCSIDYRANLFGLELVIKQTLAFQEQDTVMAACATVSLWCAFHRVSYLFQTPLPTPAAITRIANQVISDSRAIPSHDLDVQQMVHATRVIGLEAEVVRVKSDTPLISLMYAHLIMGLPIILIVKVENSDFHAITVVGYLAQKNRVLEREVAPKEKRIPTKGLRIKEFYAHDDQIGPFSVIKAKVSENEDHPVVFESMWKDKSHKGHLLFYPYAVIIPVYHKIRITFLDFHKWLMRLTEIFEILVEDAESLEWDSYLITTNDYKNSVKKSGITAEKLKGVLVAQHPRFIWRAVLKYKSLPILEMLADATDMARSFPIYELFWLERATESDVHRLLNLSGPQKRWVMDILTWPFWKFLLSKTEP